MGEMFGEGLRGKYVLYGLRGFKFAGDRRGATAILSAMDTLKSVINVFKTTFITVLANQNVHEILLFWTFYFPLTYLG